MNITLNKIPRTRMLLSIIVGVLTFIVFIPALSNEFINWDDGPYVYENPFIRSLDMRLLKEAFLGFHASNWHPLTWISHAIDYAIWGLNPLGHHLTNVILHSLNTILVFIVAGGLLKFWKDAEAGQPSWMEDHQILIASAVAALLFGLHPLHVESVAWVAERKDLLCAFFFLLSLLTYSRYAGSLSGGRPYFRRHYMLALGFFVLALLSKPMAVTLPVVLLILDWYPFGRIDSQKTFRAALIEKLPFFALTFISLVLTILAQKTGGAMVMMEEVPLSARVLVGAHSLIAYLGKMIVPFNLVPFYPYPKNISALSLEYIVPLVLVAGITAACLYVMGKQKLWITAWGYYLITLLPVIGIIQVGLQAMADRYTYLPSLGQFLIIGVIAAGAYDRLSDFIQKRMIIQTGAIVIALAMLISMSYATIRQLGIWKDATIFWKYVIEREPERVPVAYNNLGNAYLKKGDFDMAIEQYRIALSLDMSLAEAYNNLGFAYSSKGQYDMAMKQYRIALMLMPAYTNIHYNLGNAYVKTGDYERAIEHFQIALSLKPDYAEAHNNLGFVYLDAGSMDKARTEFELALKLNPDNYMARQTLNDLISK